MIMWHLHVGHFRMLMWHLHVGHLACIMLFTHDALSLNFALFALHQHVALYLLL